LQKLRNSVSLSGDGNARGARAIGDLERGMESFCIPPIKPGRWPGQRGACRRDRSRRTKAFSSEEPHARKPRNEMALNPLKTNDPAKSCFDTGNDFNHLRPAMRSPPFRLAKRTLSFSLFLASSRLETKRNETARSRGSPRWPQTVTSRSPLCGAADQLFKEQRRSEKLRKSALNPLKQLARINLCATAREPRSSATIGSGAYDSW
jgi:hypothetical protein